MDAPSGSETEQPQAKRRRHGTSPLANPCTLMDDKHFKRSISSPPPGKEISTFYVVDMNCPKRYQTTETMNYEQYAFPVCQKLQPLCVMAGHYEMVCVEPRIFFFIFAKCDIMAASKASRDFRRKELQVVGIDEIMHHPSGHISIPILVHFDFAVIPCTVLDKVKDILASQGDPVPQALPLLNENPPLGKLAVTRWVVGQLQSALSVKGLEVGVLKSTLHESRSSTSREDLAVYHRSKYIANGSIRGAAFDQPPDNEDNEEESEQSSGQDDDDICIQGAAKEVKPAGRADTEKEKDGDKKHLVSNMETVAGELALKAARNGKVFSKIEIYGFLLDTSLVSKQLVFLFPGGKV